MAQRILRPLGYGDILDEMFDLYKSNFLLLVGIAGIVYLPVNLIMFSLGSELAQALVSFVMLPLNYIIMGATTWAVSQSYLGKDVTILGSYRVITKRAVPFFLTLLVAYLFIVSGSFALIIPGVILAFRYAFVSMVFVVEGKSGKEARVRSAQLAAGQTGRIFILACLAGALAFVLAFILMMPAMFLSEFLTGGKETAGPLVGLAQGLAYTLATPVQVLAFVLLYYDIRVRKEGFDLELLAQNLAVKPDTQPVEQQEMTVQ